MEEKPQYGWYVKNIIIGFTVTGLLGLTAFVFGLILLGLWGITFIIIGLTLMCVFLWPGLGMITMHLLLINTLDKDNIVSRMKVLDEIENPQILDVGCGTGRTAIRIAKALKDGSN